MKIWIVSIFCTVGLGATMLTLGVHPVSRLEAANGVSGPFYDTQMLWERSPSQNVATYKIIKTKQAGDGHETGFIVFRRTDRSAQEKALGNGETLVWSLGTHEERLVISTPKPKVNGAKALEHLRTQAVKAEQSAHEQEAQIPLTQEAHARAVTAARDETLQAIDAETRKLRGELEALEFKGTRFEAIRDAEAEAVEIRLTAETKRETARVEAESDLLRSRALNQPGGPLYTALRANRQFDVSRIRIAPTSPDVIRFFGGLALWRDFFLDDSRTKKKPTR